MREAIDATIEALYGADVDWAAAAGLVHVAAIHGPSERVIAIGPAAPASATDRFVLGFARARADVIVTTGSILRAEPELVHCYADDDATDRDWADWRERVLGRASPPRLLILSASGRFPLDHPALAARSGWVATTAEGVAAMSGIGGGFEIVRPDPASDRAGGSVAAAIAAVSARPDVETVALEAGPSAMGSLYAADATPVDELLLSRFLGPLAAPAEGPPFVDYARWADRVGAVRTSATREEQSGAWRYERWRAGAASSSG